MAHVQDTLNGSISITIDSGKIVLMVTARPPIHSPQNTAYTVAKAELSVECAGELAEALYSARQDAAEELSQAEVS